MGGLNVEGGQGEDGQAESDLAACLKDSKRYIINPHRESARARARERERERQTDRTREREEEREKGA